jgi:hypothetical protein
MRVVLKLTAGSADRDGHAAKSLSCLAMGTAGATGPTPEEIARAKEEKKKAKPPRMKNDPKLVAAARELRDRYTEQINAAPHLLLPPSANGKYDVSRALEHAPSVMRDVNDQRAGLLDAA